MHKRYIRSLFHSIGGALLPGETKKEWLNRTALCAGLTPSVAYAAYHGQDTADGGYLGNNGQPVTRENWNKLERAAENAQDTFAIIAFTEHQLAIWETDPVRFRSRIDAAREFLGRLRQSPEVMGQTDFPVRDRNAGREG